MIMFSEFYVVILQNLNPSSTILENLSAITAKFSGISFVLAFFSKTSRIPIVSLTPSAFFIMIGKKKTGSIDEISTFGSNSLFLVHSLKIIGLKFAKTTPAKPQLMLETLDLRQNYN